jgi:hypothetical protein
MGENTENTDWIREGFPKETGFITPQNYFAELTEQINASVFLEKMKAEVKSEGGFTVPDSYFSHLSAAIQSKTVGDRETVRRSKTVKLWRSNLLKYASAACFVLIAGAGFFFNREQAQKTAVNNTELAAEQMLYDIDEQVIIDHIEANEETISKTSNSDAELESYILNNYSQNDIATSL